MEPASGWLERPELERQLDGALTRRLTTLTAAAGYGKSTLLERWGADVGAVRHHLGPEDRDLSQFGRHIVGALRLRVPDLPRELTTVVAAPLGPSAGSDASARAAGLAGALGEALHGALRRDLVMILDDLHELAAGSPCAHFLEALLRSAPRRLHVVTASRTAPPFTVARLREDDQVLELTAADLALDRAEVRRWTRAAGGDDALADRISDHTSGWPVAVATITRRLTRSPASDGSDGPFDLSAAVAGFHDLVTAAFESLSSDERRLALLAVSLPHLSPALVGALGLPPDRLAEVYRAGLLLDLAADEMDGYRATRAARSALRARAVEDAGVAAMVTAAADWFVAAGRPDVALRTLHERGDAARAAQLLARYGDELATGGAPTVVLAALDRDGSGDTAAGRRLRGLAHHTLGDWDRARELLGRLDTDGGADATVAWRLGLVHHLRGELDEALDVYGRGRDGQPAAEAAICTAMYATVRWLRGERDLCAEAADDAFARARELGEDRPLAAAHTVLAMLAALDGERRANDAHYLRAIEHAERAGDAFQLIRIRANRASHHIEEGAYTDALAECEIATHLAELTGFSPFTAVALSNRAEALVHLGRLEEAAADAADAVATWRSLGSRLVVYGLEQVAMVQRLRGDRAGAAASYEAAITEAEAASDAQGEVSARAAYAELLCEHDPDTALALGLRAVAHGTGMGYVAACLATARAAIAAGDRVAARGHLERARAEAATRRDAPGLAAATEIGARLDGDADAAARAVAAWEAVGDPIARAGAELTRAELMAQDPAHRGLVAEIVTTVVQQLHAVGCRVHDDRIAALLPAAPATTTPAVTIRTLGGFRVWRDGAELARTDWQSRKARLLVMLLASQRGAPTPRGWLLEQLWPDTEPTVAEKRLRVLVSTVRAVLDPERRRPSDHVLRSEQDTLHLDLRHVDLDVTTMLDEVDAGARLDAQGRAREALAHWRAAEAAYTGVFCPEELYADWSVRTREELRAAYVQACARIASSEGAHGNHDEAVRGWLRLLETDPYDERAHLALVDVLLEAGRRIEARRRYRSYVDRMHELGLEAVPFPTA